MSGWFKPGRRHYGRKPNTRRERGLRRTDYGKHRQVSVKVPDGITKSKLLEYIKIYQMYCAAFEELTDEELAYQYVIDNLDESLTKHRIKVAIDIVEKIRNDNDIF